MTTQTTFLRRAISVQIVKGDGPFGEAGTLNTVTLTGHRVQCNITQTTGGPSMGTAQIRVFGLTQSKLNDLTALQDADQFMRKNHVVVMAGDAAEVGHMPVIFKGQIYRAQADMAGVPDVCLNMIAVGGALAALKPVAAISFPGSADTKVIFATIAASMGLQLEYSGPSVFLRTPNFSGTALDQMQTCAQHANLNAEIDGDVLAVWPMGGARNIPPLDISPETGLIGYPSYSSGDYQGLAIQSLFNPRLRVGMPVIVRTSLPTQLHTNGQWTIYDISHSIESEAPGGSWMTNFNARYGGAK